MITAKQKERLRQFFGSYFHQDFDVEYRTPARTLSAAIHDHESDREELGIILKAFIEAHPDDRDLDLALWKELSCEYLPVADGIPTRAWLMGVAAKLSAPRDA